MEFVASIFGKVLDVIRAPVTRQLGYLYHYKSKVQELKSRLKELQDQRESVRVRVRGAERNAENIHGHVTAWLTKTDEKITEIEEFLNDEGHQTIGCSNGSFPNLKLRHTLGRKAKKMIPQCVDLLQQSNFAAFSYPREPEALDVAICDNVYVPFKSRDAILEDVMKALKDPKIKMIGIYGQGGVGKTTLVKAVARRAKAEKLFNVVVIANITSTPDVRKIQGEIADMLGLRLDDESEIGRAGRLKQRLKKEDILVILDDLWAGLDLSMLGIQFQDDDINQITKVSMPRIGHNLLKDNKKTSDSQRCKILLTSRDKEILLSEMEMKDLIFKVHVMEVEESEILFNKIVGLTDEDSELKSLSTEIVHRCANLPLAIVATGKALKHNKNKASWENALQRLQNQEMIEVLEPVEFSTMLSYDHLQTEELKSIFLLCAHLGTDPSIAYLVKYCIGLSIFQEVSTIKEVEFRTYECIKKLRNSSLLLDSVPPNGIVTMHDKVRDAALSIACKQKHVFSRRYVKIDEWPDKDAFERYTIISLHYCDIIDGIPEGMYCPNLKVFHLDSKDPSVKIPDKFFEGMKELRVLILTGIDLSSFPSSVKCLIKLRMLCLEQCMLADNMSIIGELKNLRILSLLGSKFELLPREIRQLGRLQLFDISSCTKLKVIPSNVISKLCSLEELHMGKTFIQWGVERKTDHNEIATLAELRYLRELRSLDIYIQDITALPGSLFFDMWDSYKIVIGDSKMLLLEGLHMPSYKASRVMALHLKKGNVIHSQMWIKMLFKSIEQLFLGGVDGLLNVTYELNVEGFPCLEHLAICKNSDIQNIIYSTKWEHQANAFPKLESIFLYKLESLEKICNCQLTATSFRCLKIMKIKICGRLKYLFSFHMVRLLTELENLEVSECDSLEDIVVVERKENIGNDAEISFPQLRYLTLHSLSELTCFYASDKMISISQMETVVDCVPLFTTKVHLPKLESLELSSTNIKKVWGDDQLLPRAFQNLTKLDVNNCGCLKYLFSFSTVGNLIKLQSLFVRGCDTMKAIFNPEANQEVDVFPQLKKIKITNMEELKTIWHPQASINSFCSLESVTIKQCHKLVTIFPPYMVGRFHNLGVLEVDDCESVEEIFNFQSTPEVVSDETTLRVVKLQRLPKLKHVWNKDPQGLMNFKILQDISVTECPSLENIFPFSIGNDLKKLESLEISGCDGMKEVVAKGDTSNRSNFTFEFPKLNELVLVNLPQLTCFYQGTHAIELQALTILSFGRCGKLEGFGYETSHSEVKPFRSSLLKAISNLEDLILCGPKEMKWFQDTIGDDVYQMHNIKLLSTAGLTSIEILFWFLQRFPNLEILQFLFSTIKEEVFPCGSHAYLNKIGTVVQLKNVSIINSHIPLNVGFENGAIIQRVEKLCIEECYYSTNLIPSSISLTHLSYLEVTNCDGLRNLLTLSTAKSLVQLATMKVRQCAMMEEIITVEENGLEDKEDEIVFGKLKSLELVSLRNLTSFCNCQNQLVFKFSSLENVKMSDCLKLEKFSEKIMSTPNLKKVNVVEGEEEEDKWYWEGDLNATIQKIFTDKVLLKFCENLNLSCHPELQQLWQGEISPPEDCFKNLRTLEVENCSFLSEVFPSRLLPYFKNMEELQVSSSPVEIIFDLDGNSLRETNGKHFNLKRMTLNNLINLMCIWSKDPGNTVSFINLKEMVVTSCAGIKTLFPASLARNLVRLKKLEIGRCHALEEIVGKEEAVADGARIKFEFPYLTTLSMYDLPSLEFFYPGRHTLEFPSLESLLVLNNFDKLDTFTSDFERHHQGVVGCEIEANHITACRQSLFVAEKVVPNLENLSLNGKDVMTLSQPHFPYNLLDKLKILRLDFGDSYEAGATLPFKFFQKVPNLEALVVTYFHALYELFPAQRPEDIDHIINILSQVRKLVLHSLPLLSSIGLDNSWVDPIAKNLIVLRLSDCHRLTILVPSSIASFCNLKELKIWRCDGLVYLFSSSVAKSLVQLHEMEIIECRSITKIVSHETSDESCSDEIIFERLEYITLSCLPSLVSFYTGNATLEFSDLVFAIIEQCPKMKCFSQGVVRAPDLFGISNSCVELDLHNYDDLNTTVQRLFDESLAQFTRSVEELEELKLGEDYDHSDIWHGVMPVPDGGFRKLKTLIVDGCQFLSHYVIPSHLLVFLTNLGNLQVRNCGSVKAIFDGCRSLRSLFPASMTNGKLESLEILKVESCEEIVEIVATNETSSSEEESRNLIMFPSLTELQLWDLPKLKHICSSGLNNVEWPKLETLKVGSCPCLLHLASSIMSFLNLRHLDVDNCDGMVYLFASSTAKSLAFLEELTVWNCGSMREIVAKEGDESDQDEIKFGNLKTLNLISLPNVDSFYSGKYRLKFPCLELMNICFCSQMKVFSHANICAPDNITITSDNDLIDMLEKAFNKKATET